MKQLWAPWRIEYILSSDKKSDKCIFCARLEEDNDVRNLILYRGREVFVIMNRYPYNSGHLMVVPNRHIGNFLALRESESRELMAVLQQSVQVLDRVMKPDGYNLGMNLGRVSGAGVEDHIHIHVVPRWNGDTNFMPIIASTKVISEALDKTYAKLKEVFEKLSNESNRR